MSIGWLVVAFCIALTLVLRASAALLAIVAHAARRGSSYLSVAGLVALAVDVQAHCDTALDRSPTTTIANMPSQRRSRVATPPLQGRRNGPTSFGAQSFTRDVTSSSVLRDRPPPLARLRTRDRARAGCGASLISNIDGSHQPGQGCHPVDVHARRPGPRVTAALPVGGRLAPTPSLERPGIGPGPRATTSPGGGTANGRPGVWTTP